MLNSSGNLNCLMTQTVPHYVILEHKESSKLTICKCNPRQVIK